MRHGLEQAIRDNSNNSYYYQMATLYDIIELGIARVANILRETDLIKNTQKFGSLSNKLTHIFKDIYNIPTMRSVRQDKQDR
jgi:hypothetical protein